ncbi:MAG: hypothetical protein JST89_08955 [Cyanobacteria bacterium SZAS-4]|nr:hypothetical protein [Cyanobacteria bacterium SZAS-4]
MILTTRKLIRTVRVLAVAAAAAAAAAAASLFCSGVFAQSKRPEANTQTVRKAPATVKSAMTSAERFDDIPEYTGKGKFVRGTKYDKEHAIMYMEILHVQEFKPQVIDWYKNSLASRGWQVSATKATVSGYKKDSQNTINVTVNEIPLNDGSRCELVVQAFRKK